MTLPEAAWQPEKGGLTVLGNVTHFGFYIQTKLELGCVDLHFTDAAQALFGRLHSLVDTPRQVSAPTALPPYYLQKVKEQQEFCAELDKAFLALGKVGANVMGNL